MLTFVLIAVLGSVAAAPANETVILSPAEITEFQSFGNLEPKSALVEDRSTNECGCGYSIVNAASGRIVGGGEVNPRHKLPYQMFLQICWKTGCAMCGGTLINKRYVITAMHCIQDKGVLATSVRVAIGEHDIEKDIENKKVQSINAEKIIVRKDYDTNSINNDIAILRLSKDVTFNSNVVPACLPTNKAETYAGKDAVVSGWGSIATGGKTSPVLKETTVKILKQSETPCANFAAGGVLPNTKMCAYKEGTDSCQGDSGGPLVVKENGKNTLVGVVSYGAGCATKNMAGVYVRVTNYLDWIKENVKDGWCNGSTSTATTTTAAAATTTAATTATCKDVDPYCAEMVTGGLCKDASIKDLMKQWCAKSCNMC